MAVTTNIEWADATLSFWIGCTEVSPACDFCYARAYGNRFGVKWGVGEARRKTMHWLAKARAIERRRGELGHHPFVFSNSLSDIFDKEIPIEWLREAFDVMRATPGNFYLLLTKRIGIAAERAAAAGGFPPNAAIGATFCNQDEWDRDWRKLRDAQIAMRARFAFASFEPLLDPIEFTGEWMPAWCIVGGESGPRSRPTHPDWVRAIRDACALLGSIFNFKQWGEFLPWEPLDEGVCWKSQHGAIMDRHGLGDTDDAKSGWTDACLYEGDDICVHQRVGKKSAGRLLDGVLHDARPALSDHPIDGSGTQTVHDAMLEAPKP